MIINRIGSCHYLWMGWLVQTDMSSVPISAGQSRFRRKCPDVPPVGFYDPPLSEVVGYWQPEEMWSNFMLWCILIHNTDNSGDMVQLDAMMHANAG